MQSINIILISIFSLFKDATNHLSNTPPQILIYIGFHKEATIQDFQLRGDKVYLYVRRRR